MPERFKSFLRWLAPNGLGTRAFLAFMITAGWLVNGDFSNQALNAVVMLILTYYFKDRDNATKPKEPTK